MSEDFVVELWTYAGQRQEGKSVVWYDEKFEALVFKHPPKQKVALLELNMKSKLKETKMVLSKQLIFRSI